MNRTVKEQLREYFEYFEASLESDLSADPLAVPPGQLEEQPARRRGPGWAVAVGVAVVTLAVVALAAVVVSALDRSPTDTTIAPAVTTTTPVETTVPNEPGPVVRDAGPAEQAGWTWLDHGDVDFKENRDLEIIGMVDSGVVLIEGHTQGESCEACVLQIWARDGSVQSHQLDIFEGKVIYQSGVSANLIWVLLSFESVDEQMWVSADGENWAQVEVIDPDGIREQQLASAFDGIRERLRQSAFDDLWFVRFLRSGDRILAINRVNGFMSLSSDEGQTFEVIDHGAEWGTGGTDQSNLIRRTWATQDGFFLVYGRSPRLWHSPDGVAWELLGDLQGSPNWDAPSVPVATSPESLVLPLADGRLLTMEFIDDFTEVDGFTAAYVSEDNGLSWQPIPGPYPFEDAYEPSVNQGWMHVSDAVSDAAEQRVWVTVDGYDWYTLPGRTASSGDPASGVFIDGNRVAIPPQAP